MTIEEKRSALDLLLQSRILRRCEQLKKLLRFVCEAEIEGSASELNEYLIGVEVFGRPTSYSPVEDSTVRTRAYELRNKLSRFYATEMPDAPIRIEIERGAYIPRFIRSFPAMPAPAPIPVVPPAAPIPPSAPPTAFREWTRPALIISTCLSLALAAFIAFTLLQHSRSPQAPEWTAEMDTLWKPFLSEDTPLLLSYQSRLFINSPAADLTVRDYRTNEMSDIPQSKPLANLGKLTGSNDFVENRNFVDFGSINSVFLLMQTVGRRQSRMILKRSQDLDWTDIFNSNVIFLGQAGIHPRLSSIFGSGDFVENVNGVVNIHPKPGEPAFYPVEHPDQNDGDKYALLSRFPGPHRGRYIVTVGAAHAELPWAITEYVTNPSSVHELLNHLKTASGQIPEAFQLVLRVTEQSQVPVRIRYVTHHEVAAPEFRDELAASKR